MFGVWRPVVDRHPSATSIARREDLPVLLVIVETDAGASAAPFLSTLD